ncbi:AC120448.1 [Phodopus roborovskii]|uniref:AC120448.1 protein n=1 Tax=Phodopus roborovskii TaxID=109678 RepID=A0AAV0A0W3_PHORO|nr:AC120448.1 [Phodopus roborovskii]
MEKPQTNDSFQLELEDFIRNQKARGLHPRFYFRNVAEDPVHRERDHVSSGAPVLSSRKHPRCSYEGLAGENLVPRSRRRLERLRYHQTIQPVNQDRKEGTAHQELGGAAGTEQGMPRRKQHSERGSLKDKSLGRKKASAEPVGTEKSKHGKGTSRDAGDATRGRHHSHRKKKEPEERDLWDEAILGSCY